MLLTTLPSDILKDEVCAHLDVTRLGRLVRSSKNPIWKDAFKKLQNNLKKELFSAEDGGGKWCWIHPPAEHCFDECQKREGTLVRHMLKLGSYSVYRDFDSFLEFHPERHCTYLISDAELRIRWVCSGKNVVGCMLYGYDLEWDVQCVHDHHTSQSSEESSSDGEMDGL